MTKYIVTFDVEVSAEHPLKAWEAREAFNRARDHVAALQTPPADAFVTMPTGGMTGEPRTVDWPGWSCMFQVEEKE